MSDIGVLKGTKVKNNSIQISKMSNMQVTVQFYQLQHFYTVFHLMSCVNGSSNEF